MSLWKLILMINTEIQKSKMCFSSCSHNCVFELLYVLVYVRKQSSRVKICTYIILHGTSLT